MDTVSRPFRFGVQASSLVSRSGWLEMARRVEALGYSTLTMPDHFDAQLAPVPALQCAADATSELRVGALVFDNDYKHPVVLAKELATIDVLSDGRLEIGLGAGWQRSDYDRSGIAYDPAGVRIDRFVEGLAVIRGAMGPDVFSFDGAHYRINNYDGLPKPMQQLPPVLIGGGGPRMLRLAARHADIVGVNANLRSGQIDAETFASMTATAVDDKIAWVRTAAADAGRSDAIELNIRTFLVTVTDDVEATILAMAEFAGVQADLLASSPYALIGPPSLLVEQLLERRERWGFSYVIVGDDSYEAFAPVVAELAGQHS